MKALHYFTVLFCIVGISLGSCKKDTPIAPSASPPTAKSNEIKTNLNGQAWSGSILSWAVSGGTRQINANASNSSIQIFMPEDTTGTFNATDNIVTVSYNDGTSTWSNNISGQVQITANSNDHVEGEFEVSLTSYFSNTDTIVLTSGTFYFK